MDMTILDSLGGQAAVIKTGEAPQLNLTPDAETLALFAGLFAILQPREEGDDGQPSPGPDARLETLSLGDTGQQVDIARSSLEALPAAARFMMDGLQAPSAPGEQPEMAESLSLARLLIAAKSLSSDKEDLPVADTKMSPDADLEPPADMTTAKAILARAIEILDDIDNVSVQPVVGGVEADVALPPVSGEEMAIHHAGRRHLPVGALPLEDNPEDGPVVQMVAQPAPTREFVGPMLAVPVVEAPYRIVVPPAPSPDFVGPMPAVPVVEAVASEVAQVAPSAEFVGPMPAVPVIEVAPAKVAKPVPSAEFVGPMPAVPLVLTAAPKVLQERPSVEFVGPMPAVPVLLNAAPKMAQTRPSAEFVGPMPAMSAAELSASALVHPGRLAEPVGPTPAVSGAAAPLNVPVQPVPMATPKALTPATQNPATQNPATQNPATQTAITAATSVQALPVAHQPDLDGAAISRDGLSPLKVSPDQKPGDTVSSDMVKTPVKMAARTVSGTGAIKKDGQQAATPQAVALSRDINAYAEKAATAPSTSTSSTGTSGSAQQSSGTSTVAVSAGQTGGQMSGQNQSGQGGGHASSQGFADAAPSRDAAERTMLHRLNTANAGWSDTMIKRLTSDLRSGVQTVRIILEPRHLGRRNVDLGLRDGRASIRIAAETAEAASLLAGARGQLGQLFEQSGMRLASFQTSAGGQDAGMDGNGGQQGQTQSDANGKNAGRDQGFSNKLNTADSEMGQPDENSDEQDFAPRKGESAVLSILA